MCEVTHCHYGEDQAVAPEHIGDNGCIKIVKNLTNKLIGLLHGFGSEPDAGEGDKYKGIGNFPEPDRPMFAMLVWTHLPPLLINDKPDPV